MDNIDQQIAEVEKQLRDLPHHKATDHHIGRLRAKLAQLKDRQIESSIKSKGGGGGGGYAVKKTGDATVVLVGPPSAGKSTLINKFTNAESKVAAYAFTTVSVVPGMMKYKGAYIQILDVPGLIEGAKAGKGRGREVLSVARNSDLLIIMTDTDRLGELERITNELTGAGIRLDMNPPDVLVEKKVEGGLNIHTNIVQDFDKETVKEIAKEFGIKSGDITIREKISLDRLIDAFSKSRVYLPSLMVINKADSEEIRNSIDAGDALFISADKDFGLDELRAKIWEKLCFATIYLVRVNEKPDLSEPLIVKTSQTLKDVAISIGTNFVEGKSFAKIWGTGALFPGQEVSLETKVLDGMQVRFL